MPYLTSIQALSLFTKIPLDFAVIPHLTSLEAMKWKAEFTTLTNLRKLQIPVYRNEMNEGLKRLTNLTELCLNDEKSSMSKLPALPQLVSLKLQLDYVSESAFENLPSLKELHITSRKSFTGSNLPMLINLKTLLLEYRNYGNKTSIFSELTSLTDLELVNFLSLEGRDFFHLTNLRRLWIVDSGVYGIRLRDLSHLTNLTSVGMILCSYKNEIAKLKNFLPHLKELNLCVDI